MRISKLSSVICAIVVCAGFISVRADDTPAQAAARAALEQKMQALDAQQNGTNAEEPPVIVVTPSGATQEQPATTAPVETPVVATPPPAETQPVVVAPATPETTPTATQTETTNAPTSSAAENQAKALQALQQKMADLDRQQAETPSSAPANTQPEPTVPVVAVAPASEPAKVNYPGKELGLQPIEAPPLPISEDKQARLQTLLAKYMADQITPDEYHKQRAAILAEP